MCDPMMHAEYWRNKKPLRFDWAGEHGYPFTKEDLEQSVINLIINDDFHPPWDPPVYVRKEPWFDSIHTRRLKYELGLLNGPSRDEYIPGMQKMPQYPKLSTLTKAQHMAGLKVLTDIYSCQPWDYPIPEKDDYDSFEKITDIYEAEQKEYRLWAKKCWMNGDCIRTLNPTLIVETVYDTQFQLKKKEFRSMPDEFTMVADMALEPKEEAFKIKLVKDLKIVNIRTVPAVDFPPKITKDLCIMKTDGIEIPCTGDAIKFMLPHEEKLTTLKPPEINRKLALFALENGANFIASEKALQSILETQLTWKLPVTVEAVPCPEGGGVKTVVVLGSGFHVQKECGKQRYFEAFRRLLFNTFIKSEDTAPSCTPVPEEDTHVEHQHFWNTENDRESNRHTDASSENIPTTEPIFSGFTKYEDTAPSCSRVPPEDTHVKHQHFWNTENDKESKGSTNASSENIPTSEPIFSGFTKSEDTAPSCSAVPQEHTTIEVKHQHFWNTENDRESNGHTDKNKPTSEPIFIFGGFTKSEDTAPSCSRVPQEHTQVKHQHFWNTENDRESNLSNDARSENIPTSEPIFRGFTKSEDTAPSCSAVPQEHTQVKHQPFWNTENDKESNVSTNASSENIPTSEPIFSGFTKSEDTAPSCSAVPQEHTQVKQQHFWNTENDRESNGHTDKNKPTSEPIFIFRGFTKSEDTAPSCSAVPEEHTQVKHQHIWNTENDRESNGHTDASSENIPTSEPIFSGFTLPEDSAPSPSIPCSSGHQKENNLESHHQWRTSENNETDAISTASSENITHSELTDGILPDVSASTTSSFRNWFPREEDSNMEQLSNTSEQSKECTNNAPTPNYASSVASSDSNPLDEQESDYSAPAYGVASYEEGLPPPRSFVKWQVKNTTTKKSFDLIIHAAHKCQNYQSGLEVILEPIVEWQPELGACKLSPGREQALSLALILRPEAELWMVRVDYKTGKVIVIDRVTEESWKEGYCDKREEIAGRIHGAIEQLRLLTPGQYILAHDPCHDSHAMIYKESEAVGAGFAGYTISLHTNREDLPEPEEALLAKTHCPELCGALLPYHKAQKILPLAFPYKKKQVQGYKKKPPPAAPANLQERQRRNKKKRMKEKRRRAKARAAKAAQEKLLTGTS